MCYDERCRHSIACGCDRCNPLCSCGHRDSEHRSDHEGAIPCEITPCECRDFTLAQG
jgi:hypothetical protein